MIKYHYLLLILFLNILSTIAQNPTSSPYSRFGIGEISQNALPNNISTGGMGIALSNIDSATSYVNTINPAALYSLSATSVEFGITSKRTNFKSTLNNTTEYNNYFSYLTIGIPINKKLGTAISVAPYSSMGYKFSNNQNIVTNDTTITCTYLYQGEGGINTITVGAGYQPIKQLAIGANIDFLYGHLTQIAASDYPTNLYFYNTTLDKTQHLKGLSYKVATQYSYAVNEKYNIQIGAFYNLPATLQSNNTSYYRSSIYNKTIDTIYFAESSNNFKLPQAFGIGIGLLKTEKFFAAIDYSTQLFKNSQTFDKTLTNTQQFSLGCIVLPKSTAKQLSTNYFKRVTYRFGIKHYKTNILLNNQQIVENGISFGVSFPFNRYKVIDKMVQSTANLALEIGKKGTTQNNLIQENYIKLTIGLTFNDKWFNRIKYE